MRVFSEERIHRHPGPGREGSCDDLRKFRRDPACAPGYQTAFETQQNIPFVAPLLSHRARNFRRERGIRPVPRRTGPPGAGGSRLSGAGSGMRGAGDRPGAMKPAPAPEPETAPGAPSPPKDPGAGGRSPAASGDQQIPGKKREGFRGGSTCGRHKNSRQRKKKTQSGSNQCEGWDSNPRTPERTDLKSVGFGQAYLPSPGRKKPTIPVTHTSY